MAALAKGMRVLIVEDEVLIIMMLEDMLADLGAIPVGAASSVPDALVMVERGGFDVAVLDLNLAGARVFPVAEALRERGTPFVFASGYGASGLSAEFEQCPVIAKPYQSENLAAALSQALAPALQR